MTTIYSPSVGSSFDAPPAAREPKKGKTIAKRVVFGVAAFVAVLGVLVMAYFIFLGSSSVQGKVKPVEVRENTAIKSQPKNLALRGQHFSMSYASTYASQDTSVRTTSALESYSYVASTVYDKRMAVAIQKLPSGGLLEESSYKMRTIYPDKYAERKIKIGDGSEAKVMTKKTDGSNFEAVIFVENKNLLATIALVVTGGNDDLNKEIDAIAKSFKWAP